MTDITSKTHRYISIRQFPSDYFLKKFHDGEHSGRLELQRVSRLYHDFYKQFIEFATGKPYSEYVTEYMFGAKESSREELHELTGIKICEAGNYLIYCIPKTPENDRLFDYIIENVPVKYKILKRTRGTFMDFGPSTFYRDQNREVVERANARIEDKK